MERLAHRVMLAGGLRRAAIAVAAGATGAFAMPPFGFWPALVPSLTVAVWLIDGAAGGETYTLAATLRRAWTTGWCWGFGYFVAGLWWIGAAFLVQADLFAWLMPFGVVGLPILLAIFPACGFALARTLWSPGTARLFALAFALAVTEWLRGHVLTGFPWNTLGLSLGQDLWLMQSASLVGMEGLTILAVLACAAPATLATGETRRTRLGPAVSALVLLLAMTGFGAWRIPSGVSPSVADVRLRIMQPNLAQDEKFMPANGGAVLDRYLELSGRATSPASPDLQAVTHLIWPESAFPFLLHREPAALDRIARALPRTTVLVTGAARRGEPPPDETGQRFYNSIQAVAEGGAIAATYDKVHLVPFGEYVPGFLDQALRRLGLRQFVAIPGGFTAGERRAAFLAPGLPPAAGSVCYEAIFPDEVMPAGPRPGLILNVTNDGWFGDTPGPRQHFAQARLRGVERGLPLVRAANTGISAVVDPYGRIVSSLPVGRAGIIDAALPTVAPRPFYDWAGDVVFMTLCVAALALSFTGRRRSGEP